MNRSDPSIIARARASRRQSGHPLLVAAAFLIFVMTIALSFWNLAGVPVRTVVTLGLLGVCSLMYNRAVGRAVGLHVQGLLLIACFTFLATMVSFLNGTDASIVFREVAAVHIQSAVNLIVFGSLVEICGPRPVGRAFIAAVFLTTVFAILQFVNIDFAWQVRRLLGQFQGEVFQQYGFFDDGRPMGLSYSPITLATQLCLAFAMFGILCEQRARQSGGRRRVDPSILAAALVFMVAAVASGNRSPILGMIVFMGFYFARQMRAKFWVLLLPVGLVTLVLLSPLLLDSLQSTGLRVTETGDKSSEGRVTLAYYGFLLFLDNPLGYGMDFDPRRYWELHWADVQGMANVDSVRLHLLHNYVLNMLNFYGVGLLLLVPLLYVTLRKYLWTVIYFIPYLLHIAFHNAGIFWDDVLIWAIVPVAGKIRQDYQRTTAMRRRAAADALS